mgnify:CR=1 FL=1
MNTPTTPPLDTAPPGSQQPVCSAFLSWFHSSDWEGSGKDAGELAKAAWDAAILAAAHECVEYAHSNTNVYRRNVSYACKRRIEALTDTPNALPEPRRTGGSE